MTHQAPRTRPATGCRRGSGRWPRQLLGCALLAASAVSQSASPGALRPSYLGEEFALFAPTDWVHRPTDNPFDRLYLPPGTTLATAPEAGMLGWRQRRESDATVVFERDVDNSFEQRCESVSARPIVSEEANGFAAATRSYDCGRHRETGQGEVAVVKVFLGRHSRATAVRAVRLPPFDVARGAPIDPRKLAELERWASDVVLCTEQRWRPPSCPLGW